MQKVIFTFILGILITSCSVTKNRGKIQPDLKNEIVSDNVIERTVNQNITKSSFFIQKAEIEIISNEKNTKFIASIKFERPGKYLASIKSKAGLEAARAYISQDSVLVNDRINKKLYIANSLYLKRKFGLNQGLLPLLFGDIILPANFGIGPTRCTGNLLNFDCSINGIKVIYGIDCRKGKIVEVKEIQTSEDESVKITYKKFLNKGNNILPGIIEIDVKQNNTLIRIKVIKFITPLTGIIKFIPGKGYELIDLL